MTTKMKAEPTKLDHRQGEYWTIETSRWERVCLWRLNRDTVIHVQQDCEPFHDEYDVFTMSRVALVAGLAQVARMRHNYELSAGEDDKAVAVTTTSGDMLLRRVQYDGAWLIEASAPCGETRMFPTKLVAALRRSLAGG